MGIYIAFVTLSLIVSMSTVIFLHRKLKEAYELNEMLMSRLREKEKITGPQALAIRDFEQNPLEPSSWIEKENKNINLQS